MNSLEYRQGYIRALQDFAGWVNRPNRPLDKKLCTSARIDQIIGCILNDVDAFMQCPDLFGFDYELTKKGIKILDVPSVSRQTPRLGEARGIDCIQHHRG